MPVAGTNITAGLHSNNYSTLQTLLNGNVDTNNVAPAAGIKGSQLASGLNGPPGTQFAYNPITATALVTATTAATANTIVTSSSFTYDGTTAVMIQFYAPFLLRGTTNLNLHLWEDTTDLGQIAFIDMANGYGTTGAWHQKTPTAAAHVYSIRAYVDAGTGQVGAGTGLANNPMPAFIRITKV